MFGVFTDGKAIIDGSYSCQGTYAFASTTQSYYNGADTSSSFGPRVIAVGHIIKVELKASVLTVTDETAGVAKTMANIPPGTYRLHVNLNGGGDEVTLL